MRNFLEEAVDDYRTNCEDAYERIREVREDISEAVKVSKNAPHRVNPACEKELRARKEFREIKKSAIIQQTIGVTVAPLLLFLAYEYYCAVTNEASIKDQIAFLLLAIFYGAMGLAIVLQTHRAFQTKMPYVDFGTIQSVDVVPEYRNGKHAECAYYMVKSNKIYFDAVCPTIKGSTPELNVGDDVILFRIPTYKTSYLVLKR